MKVSFWLAFAVVLLSSSNSEAWSPSLKPSMVNTRVAKTTLRMAGDDIPNKTQVTSIGQKELAWDADKGRFFETTLEGEECIPDEEFCTIDDDGRPMRLTLAEKERMFLDSLQSYYVSGRQVMSDEDFDKLKEDLQWNGSPVVVVNRKEAAYLAAVQAYLKGKPTMGDEEFDTLKTELKDAGSVFAVDKEPKCYIDTGICKVTLQEDKFRSNLLYLPAGALLSIVWLGVGFEVIEPVIRLNPLFLFLLGTPLIYNGAKSITEGLLFPNKFIAYGPCPNCEFENRVYFGDILGVEGFTKQAEIKCPNCKTIITVQRNSLRASTLPKA